ncbi:MAG: hypothetical protein AAGJ80_16290 [Cyanobacteria bacterium J06553_1]
MAASEKKSASSRIKVASTVLIFGALVLLGWQLITPLPLSLQSVFKVTQVVLIIHAVEGAIAAVLIGLYKLRTAKLSDSQAEGQAAQAESALLLEKLPENTLLAIVKAGLYAFFVGTVGLVEIIDATKAKSPEASA